MSERKDEPEAPLPVQVEDSTDLLRECADAITAQIKTFVRYEDSHNEALRVISYNAGKAAELAVKIVQLANDHPEEWREHILSDSEWEEVVAEGGLDDDTDAGPEPEEEDH